MHAMSLPSSVPALRQRGAALMIMLIFLVIGAITLLVSALNSSSPQIARSQTSADALAKAKDALIGYAAAHPTDPGRLPCPDNNNDGISDPVTGSPCATYTGRLPWQTLGLADLHDGSGERLWYALSSNFDASVAINSDTQGALSVTGTTPASGVIAIVFAPGPVLPGQSRSASATAANYLEGSNANPSINANYQTALASSTFNDELIMITHDQLFPPVEMRIGREAKKCLDDYSALSAGKYPWAALVSDSTYSSTANTFFGRIPATPSTSGGPTTPTITALLNVQSQLSTLQTALNAYAASPTSTNASNLLNAAQTLLSMKSNPLFTSTVSNAIDNAGDSATSLASGGGSTVSSVNNAIVTTNSAVSAALTNAGYSPSGDPSMASTWTAVPSCNTLFTSSYWANWRNEVFYQVANGFQPNSAAACGSCLSITGSGNSSAGSGTYRAAVAVARQALLSTQTPRNPTNDTTYLEGINPHATTPSTSFATYSPSDTANYSSVNDLVLCLDGTVYCK